jgi:Fic family protein
MCLVLDWFLGCFERALLASDQNLELILDKAHFWESYKSITINQRQRVVINYLYDNHSNDFSFLRTSSYAKLVKCSTDTALRDLQALVAKDMMIVENSGKKTNYIIASPKGIRIPQIGSVS